MKKRHLIIAIILVAVLGFLNTIVSQSAEELLLNEIEEELVLEDWMLNNNLWIE